MNYSGPLRLKHSLKQYLSITTIMALILLLIACSPDIMEQALETQPVTSPTVGLSETVTSSLAPSSTATQEVTPTANVTPEPSATPPARTLTATPTATLVTHLGTSVKEQCLTSYPIVVDETEATEGLILHGVWEGEAGAAILGANGLDKPLLIVPDPEGQIAWPYESPDRKWIAYTEMLFDRNENAWFIEIIVWHPNSGEEIRKPFESIRFLAYDASLRWANDSQLMISLENEEELFHWLVWSPFSGKQETLSVELSGIGNHMEYFQVPPSLDPSLEFVAYSCEFCDDAEYAVKSIETGETAWFIDLGPEPSYAYRGPIAWSPDGEFIALAGGRNFILNGLWVFNRRGELVHEIVLPDIGGIVAATMLTWSPNSEYLAFSRGSYNDERKIIETLAYLSLSDGSVTDLCLDFSTAAPIWSPDSKKIAYSRQIHSGEPPRHISIVDIHSGDIIQLYDANARNLVGWIDLPND
jgi:hypothetical protein